MTNKHELRVSARALRKRLAEASPDAASQVASFVDDIPRGGLVAVYRAVGAELDPEPLAIVMQAQGRRLCLPVALDRDAPLIFRRWSIGDPLEADVAGCPSPLPLAEVVVPDLILTPMLAFDDSGGRLGQGGGYYDRTFAAMPNVARVGLAYAGQRVSALPMDAHDVGLHGVLTEVGYIAIRKVN